MQEKLLQEKLAVQKMTDELEEKERNIEQLNKTFSEVSRNSRSTTSDHTSWEEPCAMLIRSHDRVLWA